MIQVTGDVDRTTLHTLHDLEQFVDEVRWRLKHFKGHVKVTHNDLNMLDDTLGQLKQMLWSP